MISNTHQFGFFAQFITFSVECHSNEGKDASAFADSLTNDKNYHMILVIIIDLRVDTMLQRALGSGWGVLIPGVVLTVLGFAGLSTDIWRGLIVSGLLLSCVMIWHRQWRHFVLLPSALALMSGMMLIVMNLKLMG